MDRTALFLVGFALVLTATAAVQALCIPLGAEVELVAAAAIGIAVSCLVACPSAALFAHFALPAAPRRRLLLLASAAVLALAEPAIVATASGLAIRATGVERGRPLDLAIVAGIAAIAIGPFAAAARSAAIAMPRSRDRIAVTSAPFWLGGAAALLACPYLLHRALGFSGAMKLGGVVLAAALTLQVAANAFHDRVVDDGAEGRGLDPDDRGPSPWLWLAILLLGAFGGRVSALLDSLLHGVVRAGYVVPAALAVLAALLGHYRVAQDVGRGAAPWLVIGFAIGRVMPRPPGSTRTSLAVLALLAIACILLHRLRHAGRPAPRDRRMAFLAPSLALVPFALWIASHHRGEAAWYEADGARFEVWAGDDGAEHSRLEGAALQTIEPDPAAVTRAMAIALSRIDAPSRILVLGPGGLPFATSLLRATQGDGATIELVTPLAGEAAWARRGFAAEPRLTAIGACERGFLERLERLERGLKRFDLIVLTPPLRGPRILGRLLTAEFSALIRARLEPGGIAVQCFQLGALRPVELFQKLLPTSGLDDYDVFLDHPANPDPLLLRFVESDPPDARHRSPSSGPTERCERIGRRLAELAPRLPEIEAADLDLRGVLQCYVFDRAVLDLWYSGTWINRDDRPQLAIELQALEPSDARLRALTLSSIQQRRCSIGSRFAATGARSPEFDRIAVTIRRDYEAVNELMTRAIERAGEGVGTLDAGVVPSREVSRFATAAAMSPDFRLALAPLERVWRAAAAARDHAFAGDVLDLLLRLDPGRADWKLARCETKERRGNLRAAEKGYRELLSEPSTSASANARLAFLLAGYGDVPSRREAAERLAAVIRDGAVDELSLARARILADALAGSLPAARAAIALLPESERDDALLRFLGLPRNGLR